MKHLIDKIAQLSGMSLQHGNKVRLTQHVQTRMHLLNLTQADAFLRRLETDNPGRDMERMLLAEVLSTRETFFMRDNGQIRLLRETLLPRIVARQRQSGQLQLRIWSCACATGEEAYSLAILLHELLPDLADWNIALYGTDVSQNALQKARAASYGNWSFRGCDAGFRRRYFEAQGSDWILQDSIRNMVKFIQLDLLHDALPDPDCGLADMDLILCRNLFIYLQPASIETAIRKLSDCLGENGLLLTGHGELRTVQATQLQVEVHTDSIVYRKNSADQTQQLPPAVVRHEPTPRAVTPLAISRPRVDLDTGRDALSDADFDAGFNAGFDARNGEEQKPDGLALAWRLANAGQLEEARMLCLQLQTRDPMMADLHYLAAMISLELDERSQARESLRKALYLDPEMLAARQQLGHLLANSANMRTLTFGQAGKI